MPTHIRRHPSLRLATAAAVCMLSGPAAFAAAPAAAPSQPAARSETEAKPQPRGVAKIQLDAEALRPLVTSDLAHKFLDATAALPSPAPRTIYRDPDNNWLNETAAAAFPDDERAALRPMTADEDRYYNTKYGSPLAYVRALELAATAKADPPLRTLEGARILDYGYGTVGHLRLMASLGAHAVGVDVDTFLTALYSERSDAGEVRGHAGAPAGKVTLIHGSYPGDGQTRAFVDDAAAGRTSSGYDLITSKNTLKNGYINPARPVDPRMLVHLGVEHEAFVAALFDALKPGGLVVIYNLSPAPSKDDEPYKPWADGRSPFPREMWESAGFRVIAFDENDDAAARDMARALGWDKGGMNLETDLFGLYTILQRPAK